VEPFWDLGEKYKRERCKIWEKGKFLYLIEAMKFKMRMLRTKK